MSDASREMLSKLVLRVPKTLNELRSGLGVMNYLRSGYGPPGRYFSDLTAPLFDEVSRANAIGKKNTPVDVDPETWSELNGAFRERFHSFTKFDSETRFCITVDASDQFCGGTLSVRYSLTGDALEDPNHVLSDCNLVDTFSKRFSSSERNWAIFERESYAIYLALTRWAGFLWQCPNEDIIDFTDLPGITVVESTPKNFGGKSTATVDLLMFLFFNKTTKTKTNSEIFNTFTDVDEVKVKG